ncbi:MAG: hypothetical protein ACRD0P_16635, partial [Stackebrandtia sp.]
MKEVSCKEVQSDIEKSEKYAEENKDEAAGAEASVEEKDVWSEVTYGKEKIEGDKATVPVTIKMEYEGEKQESELTAKAVKEDDEWKYCGFDMEAPPTS